jgi:TetR/AcrR family transcriptional regulator, transcriptional repressor for nem operon
MRTLTQPRAVATRDRIIGEARRLFALKGYQATKLEEILRAAQVTSGGFFHHFPSKEELGLAVLRTHMERRGALLDELERGLPPAAPEDPLYPVFRRLDALLEMLRRREDSSGGCVIGNLCTELSDTHPGFRRQLAACFDEMAREFRPHLDRAARHCGAERAVDTAALARYIVAVLEGSIMLARSHADLRVIEANFDFLKQYLEHSLQGRT